MVYVHSLLLQHHVGNGVLSGRAMQWVATCPINMLMQRKMGTTDTIGYLQESHKPFMVSWLSGIDCATAAVLHCLSSLGCKQLGTSTKRDLYVSLHIYVAWLWAMAVKAAVF